MPSTVLPTERPAALNCKGRRRGVLTGLPILVISATLATLVIAAALTPAAALDDPTRPHPSLTQPQPLPPLELVKESEPEPEELPPPPVTVIRIGHGPPTAMIDGRSARTGDEVDGRRVREITFSGVRLTEDGEPLEIKLWDRSTVEIQQR